MPGNLYKRGRTWWARTQIGGQEYRRSLRTANGKEAAVRLDKWLKDLSHAQFYGEIRHTWKDAVVKWAAEFLPGNVKPRTAKRYLDSIRQLRPYLADLYVDQITKKTVSEVISKRTKAGVKNATIRRDLTAAASVTSCCVAWQWRDDNPFKEFDRSIVKERRPPIRLPSDWDILLAVRRAPPMMGRLLMVLLQTGMREEEAGGLARRGLALHRAEALLTETKTGQPRVVRLTEAAVGTIAGTPINIGGPWVFWHLETKPGPGGTLETTVERYKNLATNLARIIESGLNPRGAPRWENGRWVKGEPVPKAERRPRFSPHHLRHRYAVDFLRENPEKIYELSRQLGHTSVKTTEIYLAYTAQKPAQEQRSDPEWPFLKPLKDMTYDEVMDPRSNANAMVL